MPSLSILRGSRFAPIARARRFPLLAVALLCLEAMVRGLAGGSLPLAFAVLMVAPGLALVPLLPVAVRRSSLATVAAVPALGFATTGLLLVSLARLGLPIEGWTARAVVALVCIAGLVWRPGREERGEGSAAEAVALAAAVTIGTVLQARVVGETPLSGNDWAKYILYADEIRRQGGLLIDNPYWMLGMPFHEDPATPAVYGAALGMSGAPAGALVQGIWLFAVTGTLAVFTLVRSAWGPAAGCLAAGLYAVLPVNQDILGWHGLANVAAFPLMALVLTFVVDILRGREGSEPAPWVQHVTLGALLAALGATHALSAAVTAATLLPLALFALLAARAGERRRLAAAIATAAAALLGLGSLVLSDLAIRRRTFGGTQGYEAYLGTKVNLGLTVRDLSIPFTIVAGIAFVALLVRSRSDRRLWALLALCLVTIALAYSWVVHLPLSYLRMVYFLPLALVPLVAIWLSRIRAGLFAGGVLAIVVAILAWSQASNVREFYAFSDRASLRGLDVVAARLRPGEVVVTDRCWSFLATWLLRTRTLPALATADIGPAAEAPFARRARNILGGTPAGVRDARRLAVRYVLVDPTCVGADGRSLTPPALGEVLYYSRRLVVLELPSAR